METIKMNPEVKALWLESLRNGEYQQGTGALCIDDKITKQPTFCCLGVLCDLHRKATGKGQWIKSSFNPNRSYGYATYKDPFGRHAFPPRIVYEWAGIQFDYTSTSAPIMLVPGMGYETLSALNDDKKLSFVDLANLIEEQL